MKRKIIIIIVITLIILGAAGGIGVFAYTKIQNKNNSQFVLSLETGTVSYKQPSASDYSKLNTVEITLPSGSSIKTDKDSYARVFMPDNSLISIDQSSEITINVAKNSINIDQLVGNTWNRVQTVQKGGNYEVKTPNTIAAVRGTIFGANVESDNLSKVFNIEDGVEVNRYENDNSQEKILETQNISPDEMATIIKDDKSFRIEKGKIPDDLKNSFWYKRNRIIDEIYKKYKGQKGKDLRRLLNQDLIANQEYSTYLFGLTPTSQTTSDDINQQLQKVSDITKIDEQTCVKYTQTDFQLAIDKVNIYKDYVLNYQDINDLLVLLKNSCSDGQLDVNETEQLRTKVDEVNSAAG